jgi:ketol-acid reductoisomerase
VEVLPHLIAHQDKAEKPKNLAMKLYAMANGGGKAGIIETNTGRDGDRFVRRASRVVRWCCRTDPNMRPWLKPYARNGCFECLHELKLIVDLPDL